jgi:multimeric flavodoxin WrbA
MKVLGIMGSSRGDGNTNDLLEVALKGAAEGGADVEKIVLLDYQIHHILNCQDCKERGECPADDWPTVRDKIFDAHGLIWATPLYWYTMSGQMKVVLDRLCCTMYWHSTDYFFEKLKGKAAALIATQEETDFGVAEHLLGTMKMAFNYEFCQWVDLGHVLAIGGSRGTAIKNEEAVRQAYELGQAFARFDGARKT